MTSAYSKSYFLCGYKRISGDGRRIHNNKVAFSNLSGIVWTGPDMTCLQLEGCSVRCGPLYKEITSFSFIRNKRSIIIL